MTYVLFRTTFIVHSAVVLIKDDSENSVFPFVFEKRKIMCFQNDKSFNFYFHTSVIHSTKVNNYAQINTYLGI